MARADHVPQRRQGEELEQQLAVLKFWKVKISEQEGSGILVACCPDRIVNFPLIFAFFLQETREWTERSRYNSTVYPKIS